MIRKLLTVSLILLAVPGLAVVRQVPGSYGTIQAGIDAALDGDTVLVANGVYTGTGNKEINFQGKAILVTSVNGAENTIIDCEDSGWGYRFHTGEDRDSILDGFEVRNYEVAVFLDETAPTIRNCVFRNGGNGIWRRGAPKITDCQFIANQSIHGDGHDTYGGGLYLEGSIPGGQIEISGCLFEGNRADRGAGIALVDVPPTDILDCLIISNHAIQGGGIFTTGNDELRIAGCDISMNLAIGSSRMNNHGGGIYSRSPLYIWDCRLESNCANFSGGALWSGGFYMYNCILARNNAGLFGGAIDVRFSGSATAVNCLMTGNRAEEAGAAVLCQTGTGYFQSCTMADNDGDDCFHAYRCSPLLIDSILWNSHCSPEVTSTSAGPSSPTWALVQHSNIQGGYGGEGNIDSDPFFVAGPEGDYYLSQTAAGQVTDSPCLDAGSSPASEVIVDIPGAPISQQEQTTRTDQAGDSGLIDMGFHYPFVILPTPTTSPSPPATPSPTPPATPSPAATPWSGARVILEGSPFTAGEMFSLGVECWAAGQSVVADLYVVLEMEGCLWFWPGWASMVDCGGLPLLAQNPIIVPIVEFPWPQGIAPPRDDLWFHSGIVESGTPHLIGIVDSLRFGYE